jgi:nitrogen regulatory protein PII
MKYIIGIIQPDRLDDVLKRLTDKEIHLVTVSSVIGRGRQQGVAEVYRSHKEPGNLLKKTLLAAQGPATSVTGKFLSWTCQSALEFVRVKKATKQLVNCL